MTTRRHRRKWGLSKLVAIIVVTMTMQCVVATTATVLLLLLLLLLLKKKSFFLVDGTRGTSSTIVQCQVGCFLLRSYGVGNCDSPRSLGWCQSDGSST